MKNAVKTVCAILCALFVITLCGCVSEEAKDVIGLIDDIGEVGADSRGKIDAASEAYEALDEKDKKAVTNIDELYAAQKAFEEFIPEYVADKVSDYRFSDRISYDELKEFVADYRDYLDDEQTEIIGCAIGKCEIEELVIAKVKESMKNPSSFELVSFDPGYIFKSSDGNYSTLVKITFRGTNSFGGVVPETMSGTIDFSVDFDSCTISYVNSFFM